MSKSPSIYEGPGGELFTKVAFITPSPANKLAKESPSTLLKKTAGIVTSAPSAPAAIPIKPPTLLYIITATAPAF